MEFICDSLIRPQNSEIVYSSFPPAWYSFSATPVVNTIPSSFPFNTCAARSKTLSCQILNEQENYTSKTETGK